MSAAETYGARLLAEVHEESLASLLSSIWSQYDPDPDPAIVTGLPRLDELVDRLQPRAVRGVPSDDIDFGLEDDLDDEALPEAPAQYERRTPVILHVSNYFKSHSLATNALLHELIASSVLPTEVGGKNGIAVYIDCAKSFEPTLLFELLKTHLVKREITGQTEGVSEDIEIPDIAVGQKEEILVSGPSKPDDKDAEQQSGGKAEIVPTGGTSAQAHDEPDKPDSQGAMAESTMQHVHVLECDSSISLLSTLRQLPDYLLNVNLHRSGNRQLRFVCINGIDNFYWKEKEAAETARLEGIRSNARSEPLSSQILKELKVIQVRFRCPLAAYSTVQTPGPHDTPAEETPRKEQSDDTPLFNNYTHSALLTLQPLQGSRGSTLPHSFDGLVDRRDAYAGVPYTRELRFQPYIGGSSEPTQRAGINREALRQLDLRVMLDESNHFTFDM